MAPIMGGWVKGGGYEEGELTLELDWPQPQTGLNTRGGKTTGLGNEESQFKTQSELPPNPQNYFAQRIILEAHNVERAYQSLNSKMEVF